jgi:hypothetical protein
MAWASDMGAGTSSFNLLLGLYQCIIRIGPPLTTSVQALASRCLLSSEEREDAPKRRGAPVQG